MRAPGSHGTLESSDTPPARSLICSRVGREPGSLCRQSRIRPRSGSGTADRSGSSSAMRNICAWTPLSAEPNGIRPPAAYARTEPRQNTSQDGVTRSPRICSGAMNPGEPTSAPVRVSPPSVAVPRARAIPKSMTRGPSIVIRTLDGFRSRCTIPALWMSARARASPAARVRTECWGSGPCAGLPCPPETTEWSDGPAT